MTRILLLTGRDEVETLSQPLHAHNPSAEIVPLHDVAAVAAACTAAGAGTRLIAFCTSIIVPATALAALPGPSYNFHPGPPSRPGRYPSVFALYDGDRRFGITVHEMRARVDSGPIVATDMFDLPVECDLGTLERQTLLCMFACFRRLAHHLATDPKPLPHIDMAWSGRKTTLADADALAVMSPDMSKTEIARRRRACGALVAPIEDDPGWPRPLG